jgi:hypothetical protein
MPMILRSYLSVVVVALLMTAGLAGCSKAESYRYKLTLAVNTPGGVKRSSSVVEVLFYDVSIPARGVMHKLRGEALYLDLGPSVRPLIVLLTSRLHPRYGKEQRWTRDAGPDDSLLSQLYGPPLADVLDDVSRLAGMRGPGRIAPTDLPDLVTFANVNDPKSVIEVDPNDLQATLGQSVTWNEIMLESTDEPVTEGIELKLKWLPAYFERNLRLDGSEHGAKNELANILSWSDFDQSGDLKRNK